MPKWVVVSCAVALGVVIVLSRRQPGGKGYRVGDTVEDFALVDLEGKSVQLSSFQGKVVLLNFWATW